MLRLCWTVLHLFEIQLCFGSQRCLNCSVYHFIVILAICNSSGDFHPAYTSFFSEWLPRGVTTLRYRMIAAAPGVFSWPGASVRSLRNPAMRAESDAETITISAE